MEHPIETFMLGQFYRATQPVVTVWKFVLVYPMLVESNSISFASNVNENDLLTALIKWLKNVPPWPSPSPTGSTRYIVYSYRRLPNGAWLSQFGATCFDVNSGVITRVACDYSP